MTTYDYLVETFTERRAMEQRLKELGRQDWHVVGVVPITDTATWTNRGSRTTEITVVLERSVVVGTGTSHEGYPR
jgi:hypothetical protein